MIPNDKIDLIKSKVNISEIISEYTELTQTGSVYQSLCPFIHHEDSKPSFTVSDEKQIFKCFGCGCGGSVYTFLMEYHQISFPKAVKMIADKVGISLPTYSVDHMAESLYDIQDTAMKYFKENSNKEYFYKRGLTDVSIKKYRLGYCDGNFNQTAVEKYADHVIDNANLFYKTHGSELGDIFEDRYIFPYLDPTGTVIGFTAKTAHKDLDPPYRNSKESKIYSKAKYLYGIYEAGDFIRKKRFAIIVEGNFDVVSMSQSGYDNTVGTCGTALTPMHAKLLKRYCSHAILFFDGDKAGRTFIAQAFANLYNAGITVYVIPTDDGRDPDSYCLDNSIRDIMEKGLVFDEYISHICENDLERSIEYTRDVASKIIDHKQRRKFVAVIAKKLSISSSIIYNDNVMMKKLSPKKVSVSKEHILLASLIKDKSGFQESFFDDFEWSDNLVVLFQRIKEANTESNLFDNLDLDQAKIMSRLLFISNSDVGVKYALASIKAEQIKNKMSALVTEIKTRERNGDEVITLVRNLDSLLKESDAL